MINSLDIYPPVTLEKYPFLKENKYFEYVVYLNPSQIKNFGKNNIITLDFTSNKEPYKVFLTNSQIKKVEVAKKLKKKVDLKLSKTQFKKTLPYVTGLNLLKIKQQKKDQLVTLKKENSKKAKQLKKLKLQNQLESLKTENANKAKQLKDLKLDSFIKNTLKKYKKPKPKKKKITDLIKFPEINII